MWIQPDLSILMAGIPERDSRALQQRILAQTADRNVELVYMLDNHRRSVGAKRNALLDAANGRYITFVDDDDDVAANYVQTILTAIYGNPGVDVVCFRQLCVLVETGVRRFCDYSLKYEYEQGAVLDPGTHDPTGDEWWRGKPAHTMVWRADVVNGVRFPDKDFGEDTDWVAEACKNAKTEARVPQVLYHYYFDSRTSATRG